MFIFSNLLFKQPKDWRHYYQGDDTEYCGETALRMLINNSGGKTKLQDVVYARKEVDPSDRTYIHDLRRTAEELGYIMQTGQNKNEALEWVQKGVPVIAGQGDHWVVVLGTDKDNIIYSDPGVWEDSPKRKKIEDFKKDFKFGWGFLQKNRLPNEIRSKLQLHNLLGDNNGG